MKDDFDKNHSEDAVPQKLTYILVSMCITVLFKLSNTQNIFIQ